MIKTDFKKELRELFGPPTKDFVQVTVPALSFLMIDGLGDPNTAQSHAEAVEALYSVSYALKFASKRELDHDYVFPPLEGLWWADDPAAFVRREKNQWRWTMMIMQPDWLDHRGDGYGRHRDKRPQEGASCPSGFTVRRSARRSFDTDHARWIV